MIAALEILGPVLAAVLALGAFAFVGVAIRGLRARRDRAAWRGR